jgi:hypothetical protein
MTGFADCIALYDAVSPAIRDKIAGRNIVYTLDLAYCNMRFGKPRTFREITAASRPPQDDGACKDAAPCDPPRRLEAPDRGEGSAGTTRNIRAACSERPSKATMASVTSRIIAPATRSSR